MSLSLAIRLSKQWSPRSELFPSVTYWVQENAETNQGRTPLQEETSHCPQHLSAHLTEETRARERIMRSTHIDRDHLAMHTLRHLCKPQPHVRPPGTTRVVRQLPGSSSQCGHMSKSPFLHFTITCLWLVRSDKARALTLVTLITHKVNLAPDYRGHTGWVPAAVSRWCSRDAV